MSVIYLLYNSTVIFSIDRHMTHYTYICYVDITKDSSVKMKDTAQKIMKLMGPARNYGQFEFIDFMLISDLLFLSFNVM